MDSPPATPTRMCRASVEGWLGGHRRDNHPPGSFPPTVCKRPPHRSRLLRNNSSRLPTPEPGAARKKSPFESSWRTWIYKTATGSSKFQRAAFEFRGCPRTTLQSRVWLGVSGQVANGFGSYLFGCLARNRNGASGVTHRHAADYATRQQTTHPVRPGNST